MAIGYLKSVEIKIFDIGGLGGYTKNSLDGYL